MFPLSLTCMFSPSHGFDHLHPTETAKFSSIWECKSLKKYKHFRKLLRAAACKLGLVCVAKFNLNLSSAFVVPNIWHSIHTIELIKTDISNTYYKGIQIVLEISSRNTICK